jgi:hypothetical protein
MPHSFLAIRTDLITPSILNNSDSFGLLSNDGSRLLIDGYNEQGILVTDAGFKQWIKIPEHSKAKQSEILSTAIEYTPEQIQAERNNPSSIWYAEQRGHV